MTLSLPGENQFAAGYGALILFDQLVKTFLPRVDGPVAGALGAVVSLGSKNAGTSAAVTGFAVRTKSHGTLGSELSRLTPRLLGGSGSSGWLSLGWIFGALALLFFLVFLVLARKAHHLRAAH